MGKNQIELVEYDSIWKKIFSKEEQNLKALLRGNLITCHHIGSTAIPLIKSRATLDIACEVRSLNGITLFENEFKKAGFKLESKLGQVGHLHFTRRSADSDHILTDVKIFTTDSNDLINFKNVTDFLRADDNAAKEYELLKFSLIENENFDLLKYEQAKKMYFQNILNIIEDL